ncbi:MAG TPA: ABC transporter permease subunit [candidate division Zixibacteria bacterium]|nr:ABC transporter permease subunit [candidate division Zixibacteria bacterium]
MDGASTLTRALRGAAGIALLLALWELTARSGLVNAASLPAATGTLAAAAGMLTDAGFLQGVAETLAAWALGLGVAALIAIPLGVAAGSIAPVRHAVNATVELLRPIPSVALIPAAILLLGRDLDMKVALAAYASAWPILINAIYGVGEVDPVSRETARVFGFGRLGMLWRVILPAALPLIVTGVRIAAGFALIVAISSELLAGGGGIGGWMLERSQPGVPREQLYAGIVLTGLLGLAINAGLRLGEARLFPWRPQARVAA